MVDTMIIIPLHGPSCKLRFARIQLGLISRWAEWGNKDIASLANNVSFWAQELTPYVSFWTQTVLK